MSFKGLEVLEVLEGSKVLDVDSHTIKAKTSSTHENTLFKLVHFFLVFTHFLGAEPQFSARPVATVTG